MPTVADFLILLVEDDAAQAQLARQAFARANLVNPLRIVGGADEAIAYLAARGSYEDRKTHPLPSILLVDLDLPHGDALRLLDWTPTMTTLKSIPVVLLTSDATVPAVLKQALTRGASTSVSKPVDLEGLLRMMQSIGMYWMILTKGPSAGAVPGLNPPPAKRAASALEPVGRSQDTDLLGHRISFQKTSWDLVRAARDSEALDGLIRVYWKPLYFFVRQKGYDNETSKDLVQDFLTAALEHGTLSKADPARGRFRTFLLAALTNFIRDWNRASARLKRGGGHTFFSLDFDGGEKEYSLETASEETPEALFHRAWAQGLLAQCIAELKGKPSHLRAFEMLMGGSGYGEICRETGLNESAAKTAVHRLRRQLRNILLSCISGSVADEDDIELTLSEFASHLG